MSAPVTVALIAGSLVIGAAGLHVASALEGSQRAASVADNAALAAADRAFGWASGDPCDGAALVASAGQAEVTSCEVASDAVIVSVRVITGLGATTNTAKAGINGARLGM
ncbi:helicase [Leucobacter sp. UCMA 4100]|uniref:helicase n=1 Tax=Leucobacter sp. UCMA 4100 TaxID=2810534 RepID=UPI0022EA32FF|nr:helicase [Leucobacter sp. UCMA 4100]MDA3147751.1 helicase [Leucobacter sp. UCMA 4100]